jgi:hypothetical protein
MKNNIKGVVLCLCDTVQSANGPLLTKRIWLPDMTFGKEGISYQGKRTKIFQHCERGAFSSAARIPDKCPSNHLYNICLIGDICVLTFLIHNDPSRPRST